LPSPEAIAGYLNVHPPPTVVPGCKDAACKDDVGFPAAVAAAKAADTVLIAVGIDDSFEGENADHRALSGNISLPGSQTQLVAAIVAVAKHPVIVVVTGSSVDLHPLKINPKVGAILWRGYCGEAAGQATADVLFGAVSPSGRLTHTFYPQSFLTAWNPGVDPYTGATNTAQNASYFDHHMRPNATTGNPGRTHRFYTGEPVYAFGDGMGYTSFNYELLSTTQVQVESAAVKAYARDATKLHRFIRRDTRGAENGDGGSLVGSDVIHVVKVRVTNTGAAVASAHSVLCFVAAPTAGVDGTPLRTLVDFEKVVLKPGGSTSVEFKLVLHDFTLTQLGGGLNVAEGNWTVAVGSLGVKVTVS
jgi:hypothetical protein